MRGAGDDRDLAGEPGVGEGFCHLLCSRGDLAPLPRPPQAPFPHALLRYAGRMNERDLKFFRPLWIRVLVTAVLAVWFVLETVYTQDQMWLGITGIGFAYCVWNFFIKFPKDLPAAATTSSDDSAPPPATPQ